MSKRDEEERIRSRRNAAGRFGFFAGCAAAIIALALNLYRAPRPMSVLGVITLAVIASLNIPLGIGIGLLFERRTRDMRR